ncbi:MAG: hypothetical protein JJD92_06710 [Frankiaceae bacterium]|nr:hypothetical protein [Frankiaceae bacterium]
MKRTVIATTVLGLALSGVGLASAKPGNGAQKSGVAASGIPYVACSAASGSGSQGANGFAVLNAPGKPGSPRKIVVELALRNAQPGIYDVSLSTGSGCGTKVATLTVGANGSGNASIASPGGAGSYFVVATQTVASALANQAPPAQYASALVALR